MKLGFVRDEESLVERDEESLAKRDVWESEVIKLGFLRGPFSRGCNGLEKCK